MRAGCDELGRLGFAAKLDSGSVLAKDGYFAGTSASRLAALNEAFADPGARAVFCSRGGYGSNYLLDGLQPAPASPKILLGASDISSVEIFLWQKCGWVTFYGPMVATNLDRGAGSPHGYDRASLFSALTQTKQGWELELQGEPLAGGNCEGRLLGGCLTLVESTLGTPWELDTTGAILVLEDRGMKPYQVDRALMHLQQAGKLRGVAGVILGDFPECEAPAGGETARDVARRIFGPLGVPIIWGAPVGHTSRPMLTLPLGVHAELSSAGTGVLRILEPACTP